MVRKTINQMLLVKFVMVLATISPWIKPIATFIKHGFTGGQMENDEQNRNNIRNLINIAAKEGCGVITRASETSILKYGVTKYNFKKDSDVECLIREVCVSNGYALISDIEKTS